MTSQNFFFFYIIRFGCMSIYNLKLCVLGTSWVHGSWNGTCSPKVRKNWNNFFENGSHNFEFCGLVAFSEEAWVFIPSKDLAKKNICMDYKYQIQLRFLHFQLWTICWIECVVWCHIAVHLKWVLKVCDILLQSNIFVIDLTYFCCASIQC